jgi:dTDP-4-dehydrorhamnose 3,5-epimerase
MMHFKSTDIAGVVVIERDFFRDIRGTFGRLFCKEDFARHGLMTQIAQSNFSHNPIGGTVRGFHFQAKPHQEAKLVQCVAGRIFDVALDLRCDSPTYRRFFALELCPEVGKSLYIPPGCAHAFQTLEDNSAVVYHVSTAYSAAHERGVRWNDERIGVPWPITTNPIVSDRDMNLPFLADFVPDA